MVRPVHDLDEVAFFAKNQSLGLGRGEVRLSLRIGVQTGAIALIGRQAVEGDSPQATLLVPSYGRK